MQKIKLLLIFLTAFDAFSLSYHTTNLIQEGLDFAKGEIAKEHTGARVKVTYKPYKMQESYTCAQKPQMQLDKYANSMQKATLYLYCDENWQIRLPLSVQVYKKIVVASSGLTRNQIIKSSDVKYELADIAKVQEGIVTDLDRVIGKVATRSFRLYSPLSLKYVKEPTVVKRGDLVEIQLKTKYLNINMQGIAQENGALFDVIKVKNLSSKKTLNAKVVAQNATQVFM